MTKIANQHLIVKGRVLDEDGREDYFSRQILGIHEPLAPLGTLFEDACMIICDAVVSVIMEKIGSSEDDMRHRHANIE